MKKVIALLLAIIMVFGLAACGEKEQPQKQEEQPVKDTLVVGTEIDAGTLAPTGPTVASRTDITLQVYEGLFRFGHNYEITPQLATDWVQTDDTHYTVHLRKGVKYHDGRDFTAKDVLFTLKLNCEDANTTGVITNLDLANCKVLDEYTVEIAFTKADSFNWTKLSFLNIVNEESYKESSDGMATHPIGTGPYKFDSSVPGASYTLVANEDYRDGAPAIKKVIVRIIPEAAQRSNALEMGEIDVNMYVQPSDFAYFDGKEGFKTGRKEGFLSMSVFFNMTEGSPIGRSKELRQAICYTIDNSTINSAAYNGLNTPNTMVWSTGMTDYDPTWTSPMYGCDMNAAKALVEKAGVPSDSIKIMYGGTADTEFIAQVLQANLNELGIKSEIVSVDAGVMWAKMADQSVWDLAVLGASAPSGYGLDSMTAFLTGLNFQGWSGPSFEKLQGLCVAGSSAASEEERLKYTKELWELVTDEVPLYGIVTSNSLFAFSDKLNFDICDQYSYWAKDMQFSK